MDRKEKSEFFVLRCWPLDEPLEIFRRPALRAVVSLVEFGAGNAVENVASRVAAEVEDKLAKVVIAGFRKLPPAR